MRILRRFNPIKHFEKKSDSYQEKHGYKKPRKRYVLPVVLAALFLGVLGYIDFFIRLPTDSGPAGPDVPLEPFQTVWREQPVMILGIGDSVTKGFGARPGWGYFSRVISPPPEDFIAMEGRGLKFVFPDLRWDNLSVSGSSSIDHMKYQLPKLETQPEDTLGLVFITTGGNDLVHWYGRKAPEEGAMYGATLEQAEPWIQNFSERLDVMLNKVMEAFPGGCHIFLGNIYDPSDGVGDLTRMRLPKWPDGLEIHAQYNNIIAATSEKYENVHLVDFYTPFLGHGVYCRRPWLKYYDSAHPYYWYADNLEDPNEQGYDVIRRLFLLKAIEVLAPKEDIAFLN